MSDRELLRILRLTAQTQVRMCGQQPNDDCIEFENGRHISIFDIPEYRKEYAEADTDQTLLEFLAEQAGNYINGERDLPQ